MAVLGDGVAQAVAHHGVLIAAGLVGMALQVLIDLPEGLGAVVVVGVDDGKGTVHHLTGGQHRVAGAPGLHPAGGHSVALGQVVQLLIGVLYVDDLAEPVANGSLEGILDLVFDDKHHGLKPGPPGIIDRIINDHLAVAPHGVDLLEPAVAAAHARRHDHKNRLIHASVSFLPLPVRHRKTQRWRGKW